MRKISIVFLLVGFLFALAGCQSSTVDMDAYVEKIAAEGRAAIGEADRPNNLSGEEIAKFNDEQDRLKNLFEQRRNEQSFHKAVADFFMRPLYSPNQNSQVDTLRRLLYSYVADDDDVIAAYRDYMIRWGQSVVGDTALLEEFIEAARRDVRSYSKFSTPIEELVSTATMKAWVETKKATVFSGDYNEFRDYIFLVTQYMSEFPSIMPELIVCFPYEEMRSYIESNGEAVITGNGMLGYYNERYNEYQSGAHTVDPLNSGPGVGTYTVSYEYDLFGDFMYEHYKKHWYGTSANDSNNENEQSIWFRDYRCLNPDEWEIFKTLATTGTTYGLNADGSPRYEEFFILEDGRISIAGIGAIFTIQYSASGVPDHGGSAPTSGPQAPSSSATVGSTVVFGHYEQDNDLTNGSEEIEWIVLTNFEGKLLLVSKYALDCKEYSSFEAGVEWVDCTLRAWLNGEFADAAFSPEERKQIVEAEHSDTIDIVFILSKSEMQRRFNSDEKRRVSPTAYAKAQGVSTISTYKTESGDAACRYWTRTPGNQQYSSEQYEICVVGGDGDVDYVGGGTVRMVNSLAVRPALWVSLG